MECSVCGKEIEESYLTIRDNFLQVKYFDTNEQNIFCCDECLKKYLMVEEVFLDE